MNTIKKIFVGCASIAVGTVCFLASGTTTNAASSTSWNFKNTNFKSLGTIKSTTTVDNLTLLANSSKTMQVNIISFKGCCILRLFY